ncbi:MAG: TonB-dependent receptor [Luteolibacter sp.]
MQLHFSSPVLFTLLLPLAAGRLPAQSPGGDGDFLGTLDVVTVTAGRDTQKLLDVAGTVRVVDSEDLGERLPDTLPEALKYQPGVSLQKTAPGQGSPFLRGFTGYRTLAVLDGVRYNNSIYRDGPNEYFTLIDPHTLASVEVAQGPGSVLYGSDAVGGTLFLESRGSDFLNEAEGEVFVHGSQSYKYSSGQGSHVFRTTAETGVGGEWGLLLGFTSGEFNDVDAARLGRQPNTGYDTYGFDGRFDWKLSDLWTLTLNHQTFAQEDVPRTHSTVFAKSFSGTTVGSDLRRDKDLKRTLSYVKLSGERLEGWVDEVVLTLSLQTLGEDGDRVRSSGARQVDGFDSQTLGVDLQLTSETGYGDFIYGFDFYRDTVDSHRTDFNADGSLDEVRIQGSVGDDATYSQLGIYGQHKVRFGDRFELTTGLRYSYVDSEIGRFEDPTTGLAGSFEDKYDAIVGSLRGSYSLNAEDTWRVWAGVSEAFRAPNVADVSRFGASRSNEFEVASTGLDPESFLTFELGTKADCGSWNFGASYYYTRISDFITSRATGDVIVEADGSETTVVNKQNSSEGYVQGVELDAGYDFGNGFSVYGNFTWMEGRLDSFNGATSFEEPVSRIQPLTVNLGGHWRSEDGRLWLGVDAIFAGRADKLSESDRSDTQRIPPGGTPGYAVVDLRGGYRFTENFSATVSLDNVLDTAYRVHGSGTNEPGRGFTVGVKAEF